jgi:hypothetical protein
VGVVSSLLAITPPRGSDRRLAVGLLLLAWVVTVVASQLGDPAHALGPRVVTAFLLWQIWRGAAWSQYLLIGLSCISAGFAVGLAVVIALGATGIVAHAVVMFCLYAVVGGLLCLAPVRRLFHSTAERDLVH